MIKISDIVKEEKMKEDMMKVISNKYRNTKFNKSKIIIAGGPKLKKKNAFYSSVTYVILLCISFISSHFKGG